jgi:hypothetical protein
MATPGMKVFETRILTQGAINLLKEKFISYLLKAHSNLSPEKLDELISPFLLSPFQIELPRSVLQQAQKFVSAAFEMRESQVYQDRLAPEVQQRGLQDPGNKSICMSYDFHLDSEENLKLIEVNTNASFLALGHEMYKMRGLPLPVSDFAMEELKSNIENEIRLQRKNVRHPFRIAIVDEQPDEQRLFIEFLIYQSYFEKWGWKSQIADYREHLDMDFIYNRFTDFYLTGEDSGTLRKQFLNRDVCLSPNPYEYLMLADKQRMIDWWGSLKDLAKDLHANLPQAQDLTPENADEIWKDRKKYFLKPKRAFGSKQSYKGASISHKAFLEVVNQDLIAQEYCAAPERKFQTPDGEQSFKFDLRFYAYQGRVQIVVARLYQGQVTNLRTPYGGFAPVLFV